MKLNLARWLFVCGLMLSSSCRSSGPDPFPTESQKDGFAIYLAVEGIYLHDLPDLERVAMEGEPILAAADMLSYEKDTHEIRLKQAAAEKLKNLDLTGRVFVVYAGGKPIYPGEFMAAYMSRSSDGVVILWPLMGEDEETIRIQLGYPGPDFFVGDDPRSDPRILAALDRAGILR